MHNYCIIRYSFILTQFTFLVVVWDTIVNADSINFPGALFPAVSYSYVYRLFPSFKKDSSPSRKLLSLAHNYISVTLALTSLLNARFVLRAHWNSEFSREIKELDNSLKSNHHRKKWRAEASKISLESKKVFMGSSDLNEKMAKNDGVRNFSTQQIRCNGRTTNCRGASSWYQKFPNLQLPHTVYIQMRVKFSYRVLILNIRVMYIDVCKISTLGTS